MRRLDRALVRAGVAITNTVGTMWAAVLFAVLALVSLPAAILSGQAIVIVAWVAQTFLQLVLLPIIMVGQKQGGDRTEQLIRETHDVVIERLGAVHATAQAVHEHVRAAAAGTPRPGGAPEMSGASRAS